MITDYENREKNHASYIKAVQITNVKME